MKIIKSQKGLTLIELLAVLVIMGIIAAIAVPAVGKIIENNRHKATKGEALVMLRAAQLYFVETPAINSEGKQYGREWQAASLPDLVNQGYMESNGYLNDTAFVTNVTPAKICASSEGKSKVTFYNATAEEIANSGHSIHVGKEACGTREGVEGPFLVPPAGN
ncbi:type II secretion system protein [Sporosarcina sp. PTS2304]|uniref:type II secretion system protein n=1 Tax=Sporosarcina sp. PTS2304 TaxID=2283194 RepID=UPI000E0CED00|nr:prepilin-type N-terminal cleavage/methylation domain-containing protein [Sporosarcina sp. PTS2304]AXH99315.1 type II secretion system protein [Sporosarcina sp. PTS2304]